MAIATKIKKHRRPTKNTIKKIRTHYALALDFSQSMSGISRSTVDAVNARFAALRENAQKYNQDISVTFITFGSQCKVQYKNLPLEDVLPYQYSDYKYLEGSTALFDGAGLAITTLQSITTKPDDAYLVEVITDGQENSSSKYVIGGVGYRKDFSLFFNLLEDFHSAGNGTIVFQVPGESYKRTLANQFKIPLDNISVWECSDIGTQVATQCTTQGYGGYFASRSLGIKSTKSFYKDIDLSNVKTQDIKSLPEVTHKFKVLPVDKEIDIKSFIEEMVGEEYIQGAAAYELTKTEILQEYKPIYISKKKEKEIYGGDNRQVRQLLGLPLTGNIKINPYNIGAYTLFVGSSSVNRKLVRGTTLLFDPKYKGGMKPTWTK